MLKLLEAQKQEKEGRRGKTTGRKKREWETKRRKGGCPEQAWRVLNLNPPTHIPEFSRLGQALAPIEFGEQMDIFYL